MHTEQVMSECRKKGICVNEETIRMFTFAYAIAVIAEIKENME